MGDTLAPTQRKRSKMITEEQAKQLKVGDEVHICSTPGQKCDVWKVWRVKESYEEYPQGWLVTLLRQGADMESGYATSAVISETTMGEWHLPGECPPPSRELRVSIHRVYDEKWMGSFYLSVDATEEFLRRNLPPLLRAAQILAQEDGALGTSRG